MLMRRKSSSRSSSAKRDDPDRGDRERRRQELEQLRRLLAEERRGHKGGEQQGRERQRDSGHQGQHRGGLDVRAIERPPLDEHAAGTLVGQRERQLAHDDRDGHTPELVGRDQVGEQNSDRDRQDLRRNARERRPAKALERRLLEVAARDRPGRRRLVKRGPGGAARRDGRGRDL